MSKKKENRFESIEEEVAFLRKQNAGMRGQISLLQKQVKKYKELDLEGDGLYEKRISENDSLKLALEAKDKIVKEKENVIDGLNSQVSKLSQQLMALKDAVNKKNADIQDLDALLEYEKLPWWKKAFMR